MTTRVVHAVADLLFGGLQQLVVQMTERFDPARFDIHVLVYGAVGPLAEGLPRHAVLHHAPRDRAGWSMAWPHQVADALRRLDPDIVHSHSGVWLKTARAARMAGVPFVLHTDHGRQAPDPWHARLVDRMASAFTDVVVAVSEPLADYLRRTVVAHPDRVRVVTNGVDTDALRPRRARDLRHQLDLDPDHFVLGSVGRLERIKGYDVMVESFGRLVRRPLPRPAVLLIAGDGGDRQGLERRARELGLTDRIRFLGWRQDVPRLLATLDLFVLTSRSEGTSVSLLEAMSAGICPVVTRVGGNADVLGPELHHRLVRSEDPDSIAAAWYDALADSDARARDGTRARARAVQRFSLDAMVASYQGIYEDGLIARR